MNELKLNDIADNLLIFNKTTIDTLFKLNGCSDCISLYIFYCKTAKWQKTNKIKATDTYTCKCLKWGVSKLTTYKKTLKDNGLIELIQDRKNGKIDSWYIQINYMVSNNITSGLKFKINNLPVADFPVAENTSSCSQKTNALKEYIKCLNNNIEVLYKENIILKEKLKKLKQSNNSKVNITSKKYGEFENVVLSEVELEKLKSKFPNDYLHKIENLSSYIASKGVKYKSHYATILSWDRKDKKNKPKSEVVYEEA